MTAFAFSKPLDMHHTGVNVTYISLDTSIVADFIQVIGGHAGLHRGGSDVEDFSRQPAHLAHGLLALFIQEIPF